LPTNNPIKFEPKTTSRLRPEKQRRNTQNKITLLN